MTEGKTTNNKQDFMWSARPDMKSGLHVVPCSSGYA